MRYGQQLIFINRSIINLWLQERIEIVCSSTHLLEQNVWSPFFQCQNYQETMSNFVNLKRQNHGNPKVILLTYQFSNLGKRTCPNIPNNTIVSFTYMQCTYIILINYQSILTFINNAHVQCSQRYFSHSYHIDRVDRFVLMLFYRL